LKGKWDKHRHRQYPRTQLQASVSSRLPVDQLELLKNLKLAIAVDQPQNQNAWSCSSIVAL
jgi:hypothetical protein